MSRIAEMLLVQDSYIHILFVMKYKYKGLNLEEEKNAFRLNACSWVSV